MLDQHKLLIDVGNTSIKYARLISDAQIDSLHVTSTKIDDLADLVAQASACYFCSVKNDELSAHIKNLCQNANVPCEQAHPQSTQFGVNNVYRQEQNMGADRWMAIIAASHLGKAKGFDNVIVIDAGTAITCDFLVGHQHIGGWIAPGLQLLRESVVKGAVRVFDDHALPTSLVAGTDTPECVAHGAFAQVLGFVSQAKQLMSGYCDDFECIVSGGDARLISEAGVSGIQVYPNIVLMGLAIIACSNN